MTYSRFALMILTSTVIMFGLMYLNTYAFEHVFYSETRVYMAIVMGATMAFVMLAFMASMYPSRAVNIAIFAGSIVVFAGALWLVRSQVTVNGASYMRAMIPHHSIAIMTSERAEITDPRVKALAEEIVVAQDREIAEMRFLLADIAANGEAGSDWPLGKSEGPAPLESLTQAISTPVIAGIRPAPLAAEEIDRGLKAQLACTFVRAVNADPILATDGNGQAIAKVSGALVTFSAQGSVASGGVLAADGGQVTLKPSDAEDGEGSSLLFELTGETPLAVGFMGYWTCNS